MTDIIKNKLPVLIFLICCFSNAVSQEWSPDGKRILFNSSQDGNGEIYLMDPDGSNMINLSDNPASEVHASWSRDGQQIVFDSDRSGDLEIYIMNDDGSDVERLTFSKGPDLVPIFSNDSKKIFFNSTRSGNWEVYVMNVNGSDIINLSNDLSTDIMRSVSYDNQFIQFDSDRDTSDGRRQAYIMDIDGGNATRLTDSIYDDRFLKNGHPATSEIAFTSTRGEGNTRGLYTMNRDGSAIKLLFDSKGEDIMPAWSPDGRFIIFISDMSGVRDVFRINLDGRDLVRLTNQSSGKRP